MRLPEPVRRFIDRHAMLLFWPAVFGFSAAAWVALTIEILEMTP